MSKKPLPEGWVQGFDPKYNRNFWYNTMTEKSTWTDPREINNNNNKDENENEQHHSRHASLLDIDVIDVETYVDSDEEINNNNNSLQSITEVDDEDDDELKIKPKEFEKSIKNDEKKKIKKIHHHDTSSIYEFTSPDKAEQFIQDG